MSEVYKEEFAKILTSEKIVDIKFTNEQNEAITFTTESKRIHLQTVGCYGGDSYIDYYIEELKND